MRLNEALPLLDTAPSAIGRQSLGEWIQRHLAERIIFGDIPAGQRITEGEVEAWSGASRSPVREAFQSLERVGLVTRQAHRGVTVMRIDGSRLDDLYRMRTVLEAQAAELAAQRATAADVDGLERRLERLKVAFEGGDPRVYFRDNLAFSEAIHAISRSVPLCEVLQVIGVQALRFRFLAYLRSDRFTVESFSGARQILAAIRARNPEQAGRLTESLLRASWAEIRALLDGQANPSAGPS